MARITGPATALAALLLAMPALAQDNAAGEAGTDGAATQDMETQDMGAEGAASGSLDLNTDSGLTNTAGSDPAGWDADADTNLTSEEFGTGFAATGTFAQWDTDQSGGISMVEFEERYDAMGGTAPDFATWDTNADGILSEEEFGQGIFTGYDTDASGSIEATEQGSFGTDFGMEGMWSSGLDAAEQDGMVDSDGSGPESTSTAPEPGSTDAGSMNEGSMDAGTGDAGMDDAGGSTDADATTNSGG